MLQAFDSEKVKSPALLRQMRSGGRLIFAAMMLSAFSLCLCLKAVISQNDMPTIEAIVVAIGLSLSLLIVAVAPAVGIASAMLQRPDKSAPGGLAKSVYVVYCVGFASSVGFFLILFGAIN